MPATTRIRVRARRSLAATRRSIHRRTEWKGGKQPGKGRSSLPARERTTDLSDGADGGGGGAQSSGGWIWVAACSSLGTGVVEEFIQERGGKGRGRGRMGSYVDGLG
jgi:hypothetical protein